MKTLRRAVRDYLSLRRSLGFKLSRHEPCLREFVSFLKKRGTSRITTALALQFATHHRHHQPAEWAARLSVVRGFACYRSGDDLATEIPLPGLLPYRAMRARPYLYSEEEIDQLLNAAKSLRSTYSLRPWTYYCLFGLLAVTGVRISEALNLQPKDVDWSEGVLTIHGTKFGKSRLVPLHALDRESSLSLCEAAGSLFCRTARLILLRVKPRHTFGWWRCPPNLLSAVSADRTARCFGQPWPTLARLSSPLCCGNIGALVSQR